MTITALTDEQLIAEAAREGSDGPAFAALVERHRDRVWRICYRLMGHAEDAHDAAQEVLVRLFVQRAAFEGRSKFSTWLHGIAVRTCLTLRRGRGRRRKHETASDAAILDQQTAARPEGPAGLATDLMQMLECLSDEDRALLILKYAEGYEYEELSEMFGLSISACKMRLSRARDKVQSLYGEKAEGGRSDQRSAKSGQPDRREA